MTESQPNLRVGARGWQFNQWQGAYYPEDLPDEWRFSYYSNEFNAVLVPAEYLNSYSIDDWVDWADDTGEDFSFYVELTSDQHWNDINDKITALSMQLQGFVLTLKGKTDLEHAATLAGFASHHAPVSIQKSSDCSVNAKKLAAFCKQHKLNSVWNNQQADPDWPYYGAAIILRREQSDDTQLIIREIMEKGLENAGGHRQLAFFLTGAEPLSAPKLELLRGAHIVAELIE